MSNPNPDQSNLRKFTDMTPEEHRELSKKGNIASTESKRTKKTMREMLRILMQEDITLKDGSVMNTQMAILRATINNAIKGKMQATNFIRDTLGEKPVEKVEFVPTEDNLKEVEDFINGGK